jgi:hypothetical protein
LLLCGPLFCMLLRNVMSYDATADSSNDCVVACVVSGYAADDCAFQATGGISCSGYRQSQGGSQNERTESTIQFHD